MRNLLLAAAAALSLTATPTALSAQEVPGGPESAAVVSPTYTMTDAQKAQYSHWTVDRRTAYDQWAAPTQEFFWALTTQQQRGWWVLTPAQRTMVQQMTPENRAKAFESILAQLNAADGKPDGATKASGRG
jgi:hypothetical protein